MVSHSFVVFYSLTSFARWFIILNFHSYLGKLRNWLRYCMQFQKILILEPLSGIHGDSFWPRWLFYPRVWTSNVCRMDRSPSRETVCIAWTYTYCFMALCWSSPCYHERTSTCCHNDTALAQSNFCTFRSCTWSCQPWVNWGPI